MKLYVMRHGHSPSCQEARCATDAERPLSDKGRADARAQAERLKAAGEAPALILHSPLRRAAETAAEAAAALGVPKEAFEPLSNQLGPEDLARALAPRLKAAGAVLCVGHQPQVGELCAFLAGQVFDFKPAGLVALAVEDPGLAGRGAIAARVFP